MELMGSWFCDAAAEINCKMRPGRAAAWPGSGPGTRPTVGPILVLPSQAQTRVWTPPAALLKERLVTSVHVEDDEEAALA